MGQPNLGTLPPGTTPLGTVSLGTPPLPVLSTPLGGGGGAWADAGTGGDRDAKNTAPRCQARSGRVSFQKRNAARRAPAPALLAARVRPEPGAPAAPPAPAQPDREPDRWEERGVVAGLSLSGSQPPMGKASGEMTPARSPVALRPEEGGGRRGSARRAARWRRAGPWALASQRPHHPQTAAGKPAASPVGGVASSSCPQGMLRGDTRGAEAGDAPEGPASTAGEDLSPTHSRGHIHQEQRPPGSSSAATVFNVALFPLLKGKKQNQLLGMPTFS